jgi:hypothetical protein
VADVLFVVITIAFFVLCVGYVKLCDRIIGPDAQPDLEVPDAGLPEAEPQVARS